MIMKIIFYNYENKKYSPRRWKSCTFPRVGYSARPGHSLRHSTTPGVTSSSWLALASSSPKNLGSPKDLVHHDCVWTTAGYHHILCEKYLASAHDLSHNICPPAGAVDPADSGLTAASFQGGLPFPQAPALP